MPHSTKCFFLRNFCIDDCPFFPIFHNVHSEYAHTEVQKIQSQVCKDKISTKSWGNLMCSQAVQKSTCPEIFTQNGRQSLIKMRAKALRVYKSNTLLTVKLTDFPSENKRLTQINTIIILYVTLRLLYILHMIFLLYIPPRFL